MSVPADDAFVSVGIILVDHGSRHLAANDMLLDAVALFRKETGALIVEAAHMELASPSLEEAFAKCVATGAKEVVIHPYFLSPGRHSSEDIPRLAEEAATKFPNVPFRVTEALGLDARLIHVAADRIRESLRK